MLLGEISYSVYLVHYTLLRYYWANLPTLAASPGWLSYAVFWLLLLLTSHLMWRLVERPARAFLVGLWASAPTSAREGRRMRRAAAGGARAVRATLARRWAFAEVLVLVGLACLLWLWEASISAPGEHPSRRRNDGAASVHVTERPKPLALVLVEGRPAATRA